MKPKAPASCNTLGMACCVFVVLMLLANAIAA